MPTRNYRVRICRGQESLEAEGDKAFVLQVLKKFDPNPSPMVGSDSSAVPASRRSTEIKQQSVREFLQTVGFQKHVDMVVAFAFYLEKHLGLKPFTPGDLNKCYYEAKIEPSNTSQAIIHNQKRGFFMAAKSREKGARSQYTLTNTGEHFVESRGKSQPKK